MHLAVRSFEFHGSKFFTANLEPRTSNLEKVVI
jgi:hypothetical protein